MYEKCDCWEIGEYERRIAFEYLMGIFFSFKLLIATVCLLYTTGSGAIVWSAHNIFYTTLPGFRHFVVC